MARVSSSEWNKKQTKFEQKVLKKAVNTIKQEANRKQREGHIAGAGEIADTNAELFRVSQLASSIQSRNRKKSQAYKQATSLLKQAVNSENRYRSSMPARVEPQRSPIVGQGSYYDKLQNMTAGRTAYINQTAENERLKQEQARNAFVQKYGNLNEMSVKELRSRIANLEERKARNQAIRATDGMSDQSSNLGAAIKTAGNAPSNLGAPTRNAAQEVKRLTDGQREHLDRDDAAADDYLEVYKKALPDAIRREEEKKLTLEDKKKLWSAANVIRKDVQTEGGQILGANAKIDANKEARDSVEYLKKRGVDVDYLIESYATQLDNEDTEKLAAEMKEWAGESWVNGLLGSVGTVIASPFVGLTSAAEDIRHAVRNTGSDKPVAVNQKNRGLSNYSEAIRSGVSENIENPVWNFIYNAGMSTADSAAAIAAGGLIGAGGLGSKLATRAAQSVMSVGAADQTYNEAIERGIDPLSAMATAITAGVTEWVTEKYSIDGLKHMALSRPDSLKNLIMNIGRQMVTEGSEEAAADVLNTIADNIINGKKSVFERSVKEYKAQGLNAEQARKAAMMDWLGNTAYDAAAGAVSGALMGGAGQAASFRQVNESIKDNGARLAESGELSSIIDYAKKFSDLKDKAGKADSDLKVGKLAEAIEKKVDDKVGKAKSAEELETVYKELSKDAPDAVADRVDMTVREKAIELSDKTKDGENETLERLIEVSTDSLNERREREEANAEPEGRQEDKNKTVRIHGNTEARLASSGESVKIDGFVNIGTDNVGVKIDGDDVVPLDSIEFSNSRVEKLYHAAATMDDAAAASAMVSGYDGKMDVASYFGDFEKAYNWGSIGYSFDEMYKRSPFSISKDKAYEAYALGQNAYNEDYENALLRSEAIRDGQISFRQGEGTVIDEREAAGDLNKGIYENIDEKLAKKLGINIREVDQAHKDINDKINGFLDLGNAEMVFSDAAQSDFGVRIHETLEFLDAVDPANYKALMRFTLMYAMNQDSSTTNDDIYSTIMSYRNTYRGVEGSKTFAEAAGEYMNDAVSGVFFSEEGAKEFIEWLNKEDVSESEKKGILQTILDIIDKMINALTDALNRSHMTKAQKHAASVKLESQKEIRRMYFQAMELAKENYKGSAGETAEMDKAASAKAYSVNVESKSEAPIMSEDGKTVTINNNTYAVLSKREYSNRDIKRNEKAIREELEKALMGLTGQSFTIKSSNQTIIIGSDFADEYAHSKDTAKASQPSKRVKLNLKDQIGTMIENAWGKKYDKNRSTKHNIDAKRGWNYYTVGVCTLDEDGNLSPYEGTLNIRLDKNGSDYLYDITDIKKASGSLQQNLDGNQPVALKGIVSQSQKNASKISNKDKKSFSLAVDTEGRELTEEQREFFKDSKVVDEEGRLRVAYHGTNNTEFNTFDQKYVGSASGDVGFFGKGFYFAYTEGEAAYYGSKRIIPAYLNITNPFDFGEELHSYNGEKAMYGYAPDAVSFMNFAEKFPEIAKEITISVGRAGSDTIEEIPLKEFADAFRDVINNKEFNYRKRKNEYGSEETVVTADPKEIEYKYNGKTHKHEYYGFEERFGEDAPHLDVAYEYLSKCVYSYVDMYNFTKVILENSDEFTESLKKKGYDGTIQSKDGDEAVAFYPEQIKDVNNVNPTKNPDIRFSIDVDTKDLIKENTHLKEMVKKLEHEFELTEGREADPAKIKRVARKFLKMFNSSYDLDTLTNQIGNIYTYLHSENGDGEVALAKMSEVAKAIMEEGGDKVAGEYTGLADYLKTTGISLSEKQKEEIAYLYGSYGAFRKAMFGKVKLTNNGADLERIWSADLKNLAPELFLSDTTAENMPAILADIVEAIQPKVTPYGSEDIEQGSYDVAMQIYAALAKIPPAETFADKQEKKYIDGMNKLAESYEDLIDAYRKEIDELNGADIEAAKEKFENEKKARLAKNTVEMKALLEKKKEARSPKTLADYEKRIKALENENQRIRTANADEVAKIKAKYNTKRIADMDRRRSTETKDKIRKLHDKMRRMIVKPTETAYVPTDLISAAVEVCNTVNLGYAEGSKLRKSLDEARRAFPTVNKEDGILASDFDPRIVDEIDTLVELFDNKPEGWSIKDATLEELVRIYDAMNGVYECIRMSTKLIREEGEKDVRRAGYRVVEDLNNAKGVKTGFISKKINNITTSFLNSYREFRRLSGYNDNSELMEMWEELNEGQRKMYNIQMEGETRIQKVTARKDMEKLMNELDDKKGLVKVPLRFESGNAPVYVTKGMRLALILHGESYSNLKHMMKGGVMIPAQIEKYSKNKKEAYEKTRKVVGIDETALAIMRESLSSEEKELLKVMEEFFHDWTGKHVNETSAELYGFKKARVTNYYPISVDRDFVATDVSALKFDKTIEGAGFLKERINSVKPIVLESVIDTAQRSLNAVSMFSGLAVPIRNFNKIMNVTTYKATDSDETLPGDDTVWTVDTSVKKKMREVWGDRALKFIDDMIADLQQGRKGEVTLYDKLRGNYAGAVLTANASVIIKQTSAYPTCAAITGWGPTIKAMFRGGKNNWMLSAADKDLIAKYTPIYWVRNKGNSTRELAEIRETGALINKIPGGTLVANAIQKVDMAMVGRFWYAAQYYVDSTRPDLKKNKSKNPDSYYEEVAKVFDQAVGQTQSTNMTLQNADIMRSQNGAAKLVTMFMGQGLQNFGIVYDNFHNMIAKARQAKEGKATKEDVKRARKDFANALSSQLVSAAVFAGLAIVARGLLHRMNPYRDDKEEITAESIFWKWLDDMGDNIIGSIPLGSFAYEWATALATGERPYGQSDIVLQAISDLEMSTSKLFDAIRKDKGVFDAIIEVGNDGSKLFGVPMENVVNLTNGAINHVKDVASGKGFLSYSSDSKNAPLKTLGKYLVDAIEAGDKDSAEKYTEAIIDIGKTQDDVISVISGYLKERDDVIEAAKVKTTDVDKYSKIKLDIIKKGYPEAAFDKAVKSLIASANKKPKEKPDPETTKEVMRQSGSLFDAVMESESKKPEYSGTDVAKLVQSGGNAADIIEKLIKIKTDQGMNREEAEKGVASSVKTALTKAYKAQYLDGSASEKQKIMSKLQKVKVGKRILYDQKTFQTWYKESQK